MCHGRHHFGPPGRRGRALQAIQIPWVGSALKQGFSSAPCILVLVSNSDVTQVERGEVDRALPGHRRPCHSEVSGEVRLPQLFDAGPESEEPRNPERLRVTEGSDSHRLEEKDGDLSPRWAPGTPAVTVDPGV